MYVDLPVGAVSFLTRPGWPIDRAAALEMAWEQARRDSGGAGQATPVRLERRLHEDVPCRRSQLADPGAERHVGREGQADRHLECRAAGLDADGNLSSSGRFPHPETRYETFRFLDADIPISTAVTMSARFPFISPTGGLRRPDQGRDALVAG